MLLSRFELFFATELIVSIPIHAYDYYIELNILVNKGINLRHENNYKHPGQFVVVVLISLLITGHATKFDEYYFIFLS